MEAVNENCRGAINCSLCLHTFPTIRQYNYHQYFHRNVLNARFICQYEGCRLEYTKYKNFKMHVYRSHVVGRKKLVLTYNCNVHNCNFMTGSKITLSSHMYDHIRNNSNVNCPFLNCSNTQDEDAPKQIDHKKLLDLEENDEDNSYSQSPIQLNLQLRSKDVQNEYIKSLASLYLKLQAKYFLTESALQMIIDGFSEINDITLNNITSLFMQDKEDKEIQKVINNNLFTLAHNSSDGVLRSPFLRKKYYKEYFHYVPQIDIILGHNGKKNDFFVYIPLINTLTTLLNDSNVHKQWKSRIHSGTGIFADFMDGELYRNNNFFLLNPNALQIFLYQDAFELCNPLGSSRKIYKVVGIYMTIGNIQPWNRSKVDQIQLVALCLERDVKKYGFQKIFDIILKDINHVETVGIVVKGEIVKGTIVSMLGDNLGSHQIGGFIENFSTSGHMCRYCYATSMQFNSDPTKTFALRNPPNYEVDVTVASTKGEMVNGVKFDSVLNKSNFFHVCNPGLPPCLAHDFFEGVLAFDFMLCINYLVAQRCLSYEELNNRLQQIQFEYDSKHDRIPIIKKSEKLIGSAAENLKTILVFPFAVYDITEDKKFSQHWELLQLLREICCILMAVRISIGQIACFKSMLFDFLTLRHSLFPNVPLRPKHHYLYHYPYLIRKFGPLKHMWTLRYESKHRYFKNVIKHSPNFKNVLHTLSQRHQLLQALLATDGTWYTDKVIAEKAVFYNPTDYSREISNISNTCNFENFYIAPKATYKGVPYCCGMYVCSGKGGLEDNVELCLIQYILINNDYNDIFFIGLRRTASAVTLGLYEMQDINDDAIIGASLFGCSYTSLLSHEPLMHFRENNTRSLVALQAAAFELF